MIINFICSENWNTISRDDFYCLVAVAVQFVLSAPVV
jgi:hypothetical protein